MLLLSKSKLILSAIGVLLLAAGAGYCVAQQTASQQKPAGEDYVGLPPASTPLYSEVLQANLLAKDGKFDEATAAYRAILEKAVAAQDSPAQALAHSGLSWVFNSQAEYPAAQKEGEQALLLLESLPSALGAVGVARLSRHLGNILQTMGDKEGARERYRQAVAGFDALSMLRDKAIALRNLEMAEAPEGEKLLREALAIAEQIGDKDLQASILQNQGDSFFAKGEFDSAQEIYTRAEQLYRETGNQWALSYLLTSEGRMQRAHGHPENAIPLYQQSLVIQEKMRDRYGQIQSTNAMAVAYHALKDDASSARLYEKAVALARETGSSRLLSFTLHGLASSYIGLDRNLAAVAILEELIRRDTEYAVYGYSNLGVAYLHLDRLRESVDSQNKAIAMAREEKNWDVLPSALCFRAEAEEKLGNRDQALADAQEALRVIEEVRKHLVANDFMKRGFSEGTQDAYRLYVGLLEHDGQASRALEIAEEARARAFLDLLATRDLQLKAASQEPLASLSKGPGELATSEAGKANPAQVSQERILMRGGRVDAARGSRSADPELRSLVSVQAFSLSDVQATSARLNSTVVSYWVAPEETYVWVVPANGAVHTAVVEVSEKRLEELVGSLAPGAAANPPGESESAARGGQHVGTRGGTIVTVGAGRRKAWRELYSLLIEPIASWLPSRPGSLLTIEPHGPLLMLPFAALTDKQGRYLVEGFSLHYTPAISLLQFTEKKKQKAAQIHPRYLLVADPTDMPRGPSDSALPSLPGSRREVAAVASLLPRGEVTLLEGRQATEDRVSKAATESTVVHFATHGIIRDDQPFESFLALGGNRADLNLDGRLTAQKIYGLDLHAGLVFLSACRSGAGKVSHDGLVGLTRAFWYAGTPSVIASLWDVADEPTYRLVADFYRSRLQGSDNSRALRSAQLHLLQQLRAGRVAVHTATNQVTLPEDPMFWASFVLQGEP